MAGVLTTTISNHLRTQFPQVAVDAVERKSALLGLIRQRMVVGGPGPEWRVNSAGNTSAGSYGEGDAEPVAGLQTWQKASLGWKRSWVILRISRAALEEAQNFYIIGDLYQDELDRGTRDLINNLEDQIMSDGTGNGSKDVTGLQAAIGDTGTYAGLNRATETYWQSYVTTGVGALALADMKTTSLNLRDPVRRSRWNAILCNATVFNIYGDLAEGGGTSLVRHQISQADELRGLRYEAGYVTLGFEGRPVVEIPGYTSQRMDFVQLDDFEIQWIRRFMVDPPKIDGDDWTFKVTVGLQLQCRHPGRQGSLQGITS